MLGEQTVEYLPSLCSDEKDAYSHYYMTLILPYWGPSKANLSVTWTPCAGPWEGGAFLPWLGEVAVRLNLSAGTGLERCKGPFLRRLASAFTAVQWGPRGLRSVSPQPPPPLILLSVEISYFIGL